MEEGDKVWKRRRRGGLCTEETDLGACVLTSYSEKENGFMANSDKLTEIMCCSKH